MKKASHLFLHTEAIGSLQGKSEKGHWSPLVQKSGGEQEGEGQQEKEETGTGREGKAAGLGRVLVV